MRLILDTNVLVSANIPRSYPYFIVDRVFAEKAGKRLIIAGYFFVLFGAVVGIIIGWSLYKSKKTLPNGQSVFVYRNEDRMQGSRILLMGTIVLVLAITLRLI